MVGRSVTRFAGFAVGRADLMILISAFFIMDDYTKPGFESSIVANSAEGPLADSLPAGRQAVLEEIFG